MRGASFAHAPHAASVEAYRVRVWDKAAPIGACPRLQRRRDRSKRFQVRAIDSSSNSDSESSGLTSIIRRKRGQLSEALKEFSEEDLYNRLGGSELGELSEQGSEHRFAKILPEVSFREGRPTLVFELTRRSPAATPTELSLTARALEAAGADALAVPTDALDTPAGLADLLAVCRAVACPVLRRDWILHPLQIREAKEAGAAGVMGIMASVLGKHAFVLSSYAASLGLDCPVEVVNAGELGQMEALDVPFIGCNLGVGLSLALPGFRSDIAAGLLAKLGDRCSSMAGATSMDEAVKARLAGADCIFVKKEWTRQVLQDALGSSHAPGVLAGSETGKVKPSAALVEFVRDIKYRTSGDE